MINPDNLHFVEELYQAYREDPDSVASEWRSYFDLNQMPSNGSTDFRTEPTFKPASLFAGNGRSVSGGGGPPGGGR